MEVFVTRAYKNAHLSKGIVCKLEMGQSNGKKSRKRDNESWSTRER